MKVLLFSCSTGGGHNSAAAALAQELEARRVENRTYDALQFLPKSTADLISHGHDFAYRYAPKIYGAGYRREEKHPSSLFYEQSIRGIGPLYEELIDQAPDAVICVHLFPAMMMTELRCSYGVRIPTYFVATDFTCSPGVGDLQVDGLCIPHRDLIPEFVTAGLPQERLFPTGIPVGRTSLPHPLPPSAIWPCATQVRKITTERNPAGSACGVLFGFRSEGPHPWNRRGVYLACFFRIPASISPTIW